MCQKNIVLHRHLTLTDKFAQVFGCGGSDVIIVELYFLPHIYPFF